MKISSSSNLAIKFRTWFCGSMKNRFQSQCCYQNGLQFTDVMSFGTTNSQSLYDTCEYTM